MITTLLITHDLFFIEQLTSRTVVMHRGEIIRDYSTAEFLSDTHLQSVNGLDYAYKSDCGKRIIALQRMQEKELYPTKKIAGS